MPDIVPLLDRPFMELDQLSQRIITILREAAAEPALLMIDEPATGLAEADAAVLLAMLERLAGFTPLLVVLQSPKHARKISRQIILLAGGRVQASCSAGEFFDNPADPVVAQFIATGACAVPAPDAAAIKPADAAAPPPRLTAAALAAIKDEIRNTLAAEMAPEPAFQTEPLPEPAPNLPESAAPEAEMAAPQPEPEPAPFDVAPEPLPEPVTDTFEPATAETALEAAPVSELVAHEAEPALAEAEAAVDEMEAAPLPEPAPEPAAHEFETTTAEAKAAYDPEPEPVTAEPVLEPALAPVAQEGELAETEVAYEPEAVVAASEPLPEPLPEPVAYEAEPAAAEFVSEPLTYAPEPAEPETIEMEPVSASEPLPIDDLPPINLSPQMMQSVPLPPRAATAQMGAFPPSDERNEQAAVTRYPGSKVPGRAASSGSRTDGWRQRRCRAFSAAIDSDLDLLKHAGITVLITLTEQDFPQERSGPARLAQLAFPHRGSHKPPPPARPMCWWPRCATCSIVARFWPCTAWPD